MTPASAAPTACSTCVAVALEPDTMLSAVLPQCDGICRPPLLGSLGGADRGQQHLERRDAELQAQRAVAVVRVKPVVAGPQREAGGDLNRLVAGAADLEERLALVLELDLLVVEPPRPQHAAIDVEERVAGETVELGSAGWEAAVGRPITVDDGALHPGRNL